MASPLLYSKKALSIVVSELEAILQNYVDVIDLKHIGFPKDWKSRLYIKEI